MSGVIANFISNMLENSLHSLTKIRFWLSSKWYMSYICERSLTFVLEIHHWFPTVMMKKSHLKKTNKIKTNKLYFLSQVRLYYFSSVLLFTSVYHVPDRDIVLTFGRFPRQKNLYRCPIHSFVGHRNTQGSICWTILCKK